VWVADVFGLLRVGFGGDRSKQWWIVGNGGASWRRWLASVEANLRGDVGAVLWVCGRRRVLAAAGGRLQKMKKSVAPALPYMGCWLTGGENRLRREWGRWRRGASFPRVAGEEKPLAGKRGSGGGCGSFGLSGSWPQRRKGAVFGPEREKISLWWAAAAWFMRESGFGFFF
jgi:hypothetical protein